MSVNDERCQEIYCKPTTFIETVWHALVSQSETQVEYLAMGIEGFEKTPMAKAIRKAFDALS